MVLYLLHFSEPLGDPTRPHMSARHYLGYARDEATREARIALHRKGTSKVAITRAAVERGIELIVGWVGEGDQTRERRMKQNGHYDRLCSVCQTDRQP